MIESHRLALRCSLIVAFLHAAVVVVASLVKNLLWNKASFAWEAGHLLRLIDMPVYWAIERAMRQITSVPEYWPFGVVSTSIILESVSHSLIGGVFYATLAAVLTLLIHRHRRQRAPVHSL